MSLRNKTITIRRQGVDGAYVGGVWQDGSSTTFESKASVQPLTPKEMELLPEGRRDRQSFVVFTDIELRAAETGMTNADIITRPDDSYEYEVLSCAAWQNAILPHYRSVIQKVHNA